MDWKHLLASITGTVDQELLLRNEYLVTQNRILRSQITGRVRLTDDERKTLAEIGQKLSKQALQEVAKIVTPDQYLIHDRDTKFCAAFQHIIEDAGVERVVLPPRSPNLHAYAERWVRSLKEECLARLMLFREKALQHALTAYTTHDHHERNHQGKGNVLLLPSVRQDTERAGPLRCRERLGGLLKYYMREAA